MAINVKAIYDSCRQLVRTINEQAKDDGKPDKALLASLESTFKQILDFERCYLINAHNRFYGAVLMALDFDIDFSQRGPVDLKVKEIPIRLGVNPIFCADLAFPEFTYLVIQEIHRMIDLHPQMYSELNSQNDPYLHELLDYASDVSTSSIIERDVRLDEGSSSDYYGRANKGCRMPKGAKSVSVLRDDCGVRAQDEQTLKYYMDVLKKFKKKPPQSNNSQPGNENGVATPTNNQGQGTHQWENIDEDEVREQTISLVKDALDSLDDRSRGLIPSGLMSKLNALLAPPQISWKQVLRNMVGSIPVPYRKTRTRLNRRQPYRADLSGRLPKRTVNIVCCIDTSGSMSDRDLEYCLNEVFNIIKIYEGYKVTIIECDAEVQRVYNAKSMHDVQQKMKGRGGTCFTPAIEYINGEGQFKDRKKYPLAGNFKDALMVYFTDGYGESSIPKPRTYRNLWVVLNGESNLSVNNPYGDVKSLSTDKDFLKSRGY